MRKTISSILAVTFTCSPGLAVGDDVGPAPIIRQAEQVVLRNVELTAEGDLLGQLLNKSGQAIPNADFVVEHSGGNQDVVTGPDGRFVVGALTSGQCVFRIDDDVFACRIWKRGTAPPNALSSLALVASTDIVRGQLGIPLPVIPLPAIPLPSFPLPGVVGGGLGGGSLMGVTLLAVGGGAIAVAASGDSSANASL